MDIDAELAIYDRGRSPKVLTAAMREDRWLYLNHAEFNYPRALKTLQAIRELCQRHNHAGVNTGCHELASKVLAMIEAK
jgi:hypothetical protein